MTNPLLEHYWERLEQQFEHISKALATGDPMSLTEYSVALQRLSVELMDFLDSGASSGVLASDVRDRIQKLSSRLPALRDVLHRRNAHVELALRTLVPTVQAAATYAAEGAKTGAVYGTIPRKSGTFQVTSA